MKIKLHKYVKLAIKLAITAIALYFVFRKIDITKVLTLYKDANFFYLFLGLLAFILSQVASSYRLNHYLRAVDVKIPETSNMKLFLLGMYYNLFLPGGIGGDGYKIYLLNKVFKTKVKQLFWAVFLDRINGLLALVCFGVGLTIFIEPFGTYRYYIWILFPLGLLAHYLFIKYFFKHFVKIIPITIFHSFNKEILQLLCAFLILISFGSADHVVEYLFLFLVSSIVATIPITVGGVGAREITFLYGAEFMKLDINESIALSFMFYLMTVLISFSGIYYSFRSKQLGIITEEQT